MVNNWNQWRRMQINIEKAQPNEEVARLLSKHYQKLHSMLVKTESDEDIFNDTFLKLTYNYNPEQDYIEQYCYYFNLLKGAYFRDSRNIIIIPIETEYADFEEAPETEESEPKQNRKIEDLLGFQMEGTKIGKANAIATL